MNQIFKVTFRLLLSDFFYHTNNTLEILICGDLSSTDTLLNILNMEFKMAALFNSKSIMPYHFVLKRSNEFPLTKECPLIHCLY